MIKTLIAGLAGWPGTVVSAARRDRAVWSTFCGDRGYRRKLFCGDASRLGF
jgi:hypothetical protein